MKIRYCAHHSVPMANYFDGQTFFRLCANCVQQRATDLPPIEAVNLFVKEIRALRLCPMHPWQLQHSASNHVSHYSDCHGCDSCCTRRTCPSCGSHARLDEICGLCRACCTCRALTEQAMALVDEKKLWKRNVFHSRRLAGVEWEFVSARKNVDLLNFCSATGAGLHTDGSCGWEIVTPPVYGDGIESTLISLAQAFKTAQALFSPRCGIHVHVDAKDLYWSDIYSLSTLWVKIEPIMFHIGGWTRKDNHFCAPHGTALAYALAQKDKKSAILACSVNGYLKNARIYPIGKKNRGRYCSLNLVPWIAGRKANYCASDTTIEFRLHENSNSGERVTTWAKLCVAIVDFAKATNETEMQRLCAERSQLGMLKHFAPMLEKELDIGAGPFEENYSLQGDR